MQTVWAILLILLIVGLLVWEISIRVRIVKLLFKFFFRRR